MAIGNNWGKLPGTRINNAKKIIFLARGDKGGEKIKFKAGGILNEPYKDTFEISTAPITLTSDWKKYELDLSSMNLSHVTGAFAWVGSEKENPQGLVFYLDEIYYK